MDIHRGADDQGRAFMAAEHPGRERPGRLEMLDVLDRDLAELTVTSCGIVFALHHPLARVCLEPEQFIIRLCGKGLKEHDEQDGPDRAWHGYPSSDSARLRAC